MKNSVVQMVSIVFGTVLAATAQDMSPALAGVKPPVVAAGVLFMAFHVPLSLSLSAAFVAGLFLDALAGLPALCATSLMPLLALVIHLLQARADLRPTVVFGACATLLAAAIGEVWLAVCGFSAVNAELFVRICAEAVFSIPIGAAVFALLPPLGRLAGMEVER